MVSHLHGLLTASAAAHPSRPATRIGIGHGWVTQSYAHFADAADRFGAALVRAGVQVGERVAILSANRPEWSVADFGCHAARAVTVPIYQTSTVAQVRHVLFDSGATVAIVGGADDLARVLAAGTDPTGSQKTDAPPAVRLVISLDSLPRTPSSPVSGEAAPTDSAPADSSPADSAPAESAPHDSAPADSAPAGSAPDEPAPAESAAVRVIDMAGFTRDLSDDDLSRLGERTAGAAAGDIATIIYTSGTTGVPAGSRSATPRFCIRSRPSMRSSRPAARTVRCASCRCRTPSSGSGPTSSSPRGRSTPTSVIRKRLPRNWWRPDRRCW
jgi:long-subunit acyl-CoA synthetase (AMP-forming)